MYRYYLIYVDGVDGYDEWNCNVAEVNDGFAMT
jgi:hypothetical protein